MTRTSVAIEDVERAAQRLRGVAHRTPVVRSAALDAIAGAQLYLKCENLQRVGAFKFRGAYNALASLDAARRKRGVVAYSSGNHAQGVALAGKLLGIDTTIVMPANASRVKLEATAGYGARVITYDTARERREAIAATIVAERDLVLIPPFDHPDVIAGQGTAALELLEDVPDLDALVTPVGGGGLLSGSAIAARARRPAIKIYGVEPAAGDDWLRSRRAGRIVSIDDPVTIAEGLKTTSPGELTWTIAGSLADDFVTVTDDEIIRALRTLFERVKLVVEPAGATPVAAVLAGKVRAPNQKIGIIVSGGNVDAETFAKLLAAPLG